jgi:hypothetical protein
VHEAYHYYGLPEYDSTIEIERRLAIFLLRRASALFFINLLSEKKWLWEYLKIAFFTKQR